MIATDMTVKNPNLSGVTVYKGLKELYINTNVSVKDTSGVNTYEKELTGAKERR